jgi:FkbM family methyltransferase
MISLVRNLRHSLFYRWAKTSRYPVEALGGQWTWNIVPRGLSSDSVVYCAGAGDDISFEKEIADRFHCQVLILDPSPTGEKTMSLPENQRPEFRFEPKGLANQDATFYFDVPEDRTRGSYTLRSTQPTPEEAEQCMSLPCLSLPTLMKKHGHDHIDLLKMDIEGFEYGVLDQILSQGICVRQICVEFHHFLLPQFSNKDTIKAILRLRQARYHLVYQIHWDHTFILRPETQL